MKKKFLTLLSIIVFGVFLFGGIDDFIVEKYVAYDIIWLVSAIIII